MKTIVKHSLIAQSQVLLWLACSLILLVMFRDYSSVISTVVVLTVLSLLWLYVGFPYNYKQICSRLGIRFEYRLDYVGDDNMIISEIDYGDYQSYYIVGEGKIESNDLENLEDQVYNKVLREHFNLDYLNY